MFAFRSLSDVRPSACTALSEIAASDSSSDNEFCAVKVGTPKELLPPNNEVGQPTETFFKDGCTGSIILNQQATKYSASIECGTNTVPIATTTRNDSICSPSSITRTRTRPQPTHLQITNEPPEKELPARNVMLGPRERGIQNGPRPRSEPSNEPVGGMDTAPVSSSKGAEGI